MHASNDPERCVQSDVRRWSSGTTSINVDDVNGVPSTNNLDSKVNNVHDPTKRNSTAIGTGAAKYRRYSLASLQLWAPPMVNILLFFSCKYVRGVY